MNYITFCMNFFAAVNIPTSLLKNGIPVYSALGEMLELSTFPNWELFPAEHNPEFRALSPDIEYGQVHIEGTAYDMIIGPAFCIPVTEPMIHQCIRELMIPPEYREQFAEYLCSIPRTSHMQFARYLIFLHQCLNHKEVDLNDFYTEKQVLPKKEERQLHAIIEEKENENLHNSYYFELELYQQIREGNVDRLKDFLKNTTFHFNEGKLARTPVRHSKNRFLSLAAKAALIGAIPGGANIEATYQLIDFYAQECEQLQTLEEISNLQYIMLMDLCQRSGESHIPEGISSEVYRCINYIRSHTNEPISVEDVAQVAHRSSSYMMKRFKDELGIRIGAFITRCKLEEAKSMLTFSEKSLAEISSYLCFSSQSYFQNVFKKQYGVTPMQYRKKTRKIL